MENDSKSINPNREEESDDAKRAQWQMIKEKVMDSPTISPPPYPNQQPLLPQQGYATSNPLQLRQPAIPAEWQMNKIEVMAAPAISSSLYPKQRPQHPQQGYAAPNPPQPGNLSISAYRQISTVEVMTAPYHE